MASVYPEWDKFLEYRQQRAKELAKNPWVAVRGERVLGEFATYKACSEKLISSRGRNKRLGAIFHHQDQVIFMPVACVGHSVA